MAIIQPGSRGPCPHCHTVVQFTYPTTTAVQNFIVGTVARSSSDAVGFTFAVCPQCDQVIATLQRYEADGNKVSVIPGSDVVVWPLLGGSRPVPLQVPAPIAKDYQQAGMVARIAPEASAALSRRCLQSVLRDQGHNQHELAKQIAAATPGLPSYVADDVDQVRVIGNFAAHPSKDTNTGSIIEVEEGEAEWNLHVLDLLFDHYYARPAKAKQMRAAVQAKVNASRKAPTGGGKP